MAELLSREEFRSALENAIKGGGVAKDANFGVAWAEGKLEGASASRAGPRTTTTTSARSRTTSAYIYAEHPRAQDPMPRTSPSRNVYEEEIADVRHTDLLIRFAGACGTPRERVEDPRNMNPITRGLQYPGATPPRSASTTSSPRPRSWSAWSPRSPASPGSRSPVPRQVRVHRGGDRVLPGPISSTGCASSSSNADEGLRQGMPVTVHVPLDGRAAE